jgi:hypothetical protein
VESHGEGALELFEYKLLTGLSGYGLSEQLRYGTLVQMGEKAVNTRFSKASQSVGRTNKKGWYVRMKAFIDLCTPTSLLAEIEELAHIVERVLVSTLLRGRG